jgi:glycosyltransferase involved in cell wall biosynthesis
LAVPIVFCGSSEGKIRRDTFNEVVKQATDLSIQDSILNLGYVAEEDMGPLYSMAVALVMPTFFGPTNIPVLEAWSFGCPVITSDIRGIREQVGDAAILADPRSFVSIAAAIRTLWTDTGRSRDLACRGRERLAAYTPADFRRRLIEIVEEALAHGPR